MTNPQYPTSRALFWILIVSGAMLIVLGLARMVRAQEFPPIRILAGLPEDAPLCAELEARGRIRCVFVGDFRKLIEKEGKTLEELRRSRIKAIW